MTHLILPITEYRPEQLQVVSDAQFFLVQSYSIKQQKWITQKEYRNLKDAITDAIEWYKPW